MRFATSIILAACSLFAACGAAHVLLLKKSFEEKPELYVTPQPLEFAEQAVHPGKMLSFYGYQLEVPWKDLCGAGIGTSGEGVCFEQGRGFSFFSSSSASFMSNFPS